MKKRSLLFISHMIDNMATSVDTPTQTATSSEQQLSDGIMLLIKPSIESLDDKVLKIR